ncbi:MAG TPA: hypothetical protein VF506_16670 [Streptosporangiaceae bacterium]
MQQIDTATVCETAVDQEPTAGGRVQTRLALRILDRLLREMVGQTFRQWIEERRPPEPGAEQLQWYKVARELSALIEVDVSPETVRRWYET